MKLPPEFWDTDQTAEYLGITPAALRQRIWRGTAPPKAKIGGRWYWRKADIDAWINDSFEWHQQPTSPAGD